MARQLLAAENRLLGQRIKVILKRAKKRITKKRAKLEQDTTTHEKKTASVKHKTHLNNQPVTLLRNSSEKSERQQVLLGVLSVSCHCSYKKKLKVTF